MEEALNSLFPSINPNIDEIGSDMTPLNDEEQITNDDVEPEVEVKEDYDEDDIFIKTSGKKMKSKLKEPTDTITEDDVKPKRNYSHLAKARAKGAEIRKQKAEARRLKKAEEKAEKERIRAEKRAATAERNRQKARERYYKQKEKKAQLPKTKPVNIPKKSKSTGIQDMDFKTFASYMMKYENMKDAYNKQKNIKSINTKPPTQQYNPQNYPLAHLYNPSLRKKKEWGN
tara:strand:+ start:1272 stop:1958 length:687 start_codon:yes stop_codon:yes gene_type:complete